MGLFSRGTEKNNEKYLELEESYKKIIAWKTQDGELLDMIDGFIDLCDSLTADEVSQINKLVRKQSEKNRSIKSYDHPLFGYFFESDNIIDEIKNTARAKQSNVKKAVAAANAFDSIEDVNILINPEGTLERQKLSDIPEIKIQNITKSFDMDAKLPTFVVIDLETTGLKPSTDRIVQICALRYEQFEPTEAFISYVNPGKHIPEDASKINGIVDADVEDAPTLAEIYESLLAFIGNSAIVGFNTSFDLQFLFCSGIDLISKRKIYDAKALAKKLYKGDIDYYSLSNVLAYNGISIKEMHDAKVDCFATGMVFNRMLKEITSY